MNEFVRCARCRKIRPVNAHGLCSSCFKLHGVLPKPETRSERDAKMTRCFLPCPKCHRDHLYVKQNDAWVTGECGAPTTETREQIRSAFVRISAQLIADPIVRGILRQSPDGERLIEQIEREVSRHAVERR